MRLKFLFTLAAVISVTELQGQNLSIGIVGGGSLTNSFPTENFLTGPTGIRFYSTSKDYIVGPALEYHFTPNWSVEVDGLFRTLHLIFAGTEASGLNSVSPSPVVTWEFPILAKYRLPGRKLVPLVELGPSFRTAGNLNGSNPSHFGVTAGIGVELHIAHNLTIAPALRYTRWEGDDVGVDHPRSSPNQVELVAEFSATSPTDTQPLGTHMFAGVLVGTGLTDDIRTQGFSETSGTQTFSEITTARRSVIAGAMVGVHLPKRFSIEVNGLYRPLRTETVTAYNGTKGTPSLGSTATWELPVLVKYKFPFHLLTPLVEAGPSFRLPPGGPFSNHGVTAGAGVELHARLLKIAPEVRFTHWAADTPPGSSGTIPNQVELLVGFYF